MFQAGKVHNVTAEMENLNLEVLGISDVQWPASGECTLPTDNSMI